MPTWKRSTESNALYSAGAREYVRHAELSPYNARCERPAMLSAIGAVDGMTVLDAGCAGGFYSATFARKAAKVIALDASAEMVQIVREKQLANVEVFEHDLALPMPWIASNSVDVVCSSLAMHYLAEWHGALREFTRVLKPGGRFVCSVHHPAQTASMVEDYFSTQPVEDRWTVLGRTVKVRYVHRSLETIISGIIEAGFQLRDIVEPRLPADDRPGSLEHGLATRPSFLIIEAVSPQ